MFININQSYLIKYPIAEIPNHKQRRGNPESPGINVLNNVLFVSLQAESLSLEKYQFIFTPLSAGVTGE